MIATLDKTRQTRVLYIFSIIAIGALLLVLFLLSQKVPTPTINSVQSYDGVVSSETVSIPVTIADTPQEHEQGLSGTEFLDKGAGKLFVFNTSGKYGFWMKDMNYGLDIVWLDENLKIVGISNGVMPSSYPNIFYPPSDVKYVLEVNAGFSTAKNLSINQLLTFSNNLSF